MRINMDSYLTRVCYRHIYHVTTSVIVTNHHIMDLAGIYHLPGGFLLAVQFVLWFRYVLYYLGVCGCLDSGLYIYNIYLFGESCSAGRKILMLDCI